MKEISIDYRRLKTVALSLLILPTLVFFVGWIKLLYSVPLSIVLIGSLIFALRKDEDKRQLKISIPELIMIAVVVIAWCVLIGIGGFTASKNDLFWRNPIYGDLIYKHWPVKYKGDMKGLSLSYYIGYWMVPGAFTKLFKGLGKDTAWTIGRFALVGWTSVLLFVCVLLLKMYTGAKGFLRTLFIVLLFVFFSDMDTVQKWVQKILDNPGELNDQERHYELMTYCWQYSCMTTQLGWVFNQAVPAWLATLLFLNEKSAKCYALIGLSLMLTSPLPLIGLCVYMLAFAARDIFRYIREKRLKKSITEIVSLSNILAVASIFPPVGLYLSTNKASGSTIVALNYVSIHWRSYVALLIGGFAVAVVILFGKKRIFEYSLLLASFLIFPVVFIGNAAYDVMNDPYAKAEMSDFCMRVSIPAVVMLLCMVGKYLLENYSFTKDVRSRLLTIFLVMSLMAPYVEFKASIEGALDSEKAYFYPYDKSLISLEEMDPAKIFNFDENGKPIKEESNFVCVTKKSTFHKYLARK